MNSSSLVVRLLPVSGERLFYVRHFRIFCFVYTYFLVSGIKNICLLLGKQIFRFFYFFMGRK